MYTGQKNCEFQSDWMAHSISYSINWYSSGSKSFYNPKKSLFYSVFIDIESDAAFAHAKSLNYGTNK